MGTVIDGQLGNDRSIWNVKRTKEEKKQLMRKMR